MDYATIEQDQGIRFVWNNIPSTRVEVMKNIIPLSVLYTPFFQKEEPILKLESKPLICQKCKWVANSYCFIDYTSLKYDCSNCSVRSNLSSYHQNIVHEGYTIPEFEAQNSIIEYVLEENDRNLPFLFFIVDTCLSETEFSSLKHTLYNTIDQLENVYIGIITVSQHVYLHDLISPFMTEIIVSGGKEYTQEQLLTNLKLKEAIANHMNENQFIQRIENCKERLLKIIQKLKPSQFEVKKTERALRGTGQAFAVAISVISSFGGFGGRIVSFLGGPCTLGPGKIISEQLTDVYRNHNDLEENSNAILQFNNAKRFYESLIPFANKKGITIDLFAFCLTQFGLGEMRNLIEKTGGLVVNEEEFISDVFKNSLQKYIAQITCEQSVYNAKMNINVSKELYLSGLLGPAQLIEKDKDFPKDADNQIGETGGNSFYINSTINTYTYLLFFSHRDVKVNGNQKPCYFQMQTVYNNIRGQKIMRISTFMRQFFDDPKMALAGFDQEAAIASIARLSSHKGEQIQVVDLVYWLNSVLIKFMRQFAQFTPNKDDSFNCPDTISLLPQFMFYFRKSYFVQKFGTSIDESAFYKMTLNRENLTNMMVMIQPALFAYTLDSQQPTPVQCELEQLKPDIVILVDTYFHVLIWHGSVIHEWVKQGYHEMEEYSHIKTLLEQPMEDANFIVEDRLPNPMVITCYQGSPQERLLKSKLNPSNGNNNFGQENENYITDDVTLKKFMDYLIKLVVKQQ